MKIAILGPGALGCLLAVRLLEAGEDVFLVDYRPDRLARLSESGIHFHTLDGAVRVIPVSMALATEVGPAALTLMAVKSYQTKAAAAALPVLTAGGGLALSLQNGVGNVEVMAAVMGKKRLLAGVAFFGATHLGEGRVLLAGEGDILLGPTQEAEIAPTEIEAVVQTFRRAKFSCHSRRDIEAVLWEKLILNAAINPLTALLRVPNGALPALLRAWEVAVAAAQEALAVGRAAGLTLTLDPEPRLFEVCTATAPNRSSMLQDILASRPTEIDALNGAVTARGEALDVPTPVNGLLTRLLKALEAAADLQVG